MTTTAYKMPGQKKVEEVKTEELWVAEGWEKQVTAELVAERPNRHAGTIIDGEPTKRLTIDVPVSLHKRMRSYCAEHGITHADLVRRFLRKELS